MTPILEGLGGVQKMSKSLNNAIGINEPASEMYGKLMSISDELMWKYWVLLTDLKQSEIDAMRADVAAGKLHPMEAKKKLARTITAGFHGEAAADSADENWARMFQQKEDVDALAEEVRVDWEKVVVADAVTLGRLRSDSKGSFHVNVGKLLVALGISESRTQGDRQASVGVMIDGVKRTAAILEVPGRPSRFTVRVGKRAKVAVIG
jgi:tyrosyl-tRNA synthetase